MVRENLPSDAAGGDGTSPPLRSGHWSLLSYAVLGMTIAVMLAGGGYWLATRPHPPSLEILLPTPTVAAPVVAHVAGEVNSPGVYTLPPGSRVDSALAAAGGPTSNADVNALNRAALIVDGQRIEVPRLPASRPAAAAPALAQPTVAPTAAGAVPDTHEATAELSTGQDSSSPPEATQPPAAEGLIDLNTATAEELESLPGIGPVRARLIIDSRVMRGPFTEVDDLLEIPGIGPRTLEKIRPFVTAR